MLIPVLPHVIRTPYPLGVPLYRRLGDDPGFLRATHNGVVPEDTLGYHLYLTSTADIRMGDWFVQLGDDEDPILRRCVEDRWYNKHIMSAFAGTPDPLADFGALYGYYPYRMVHPTLQEEMLHPEQMPAYRRRVEATTNETLELPGVPEAYLAEYLRDPKLVVSVSETRAGQQTAVVTYAKNQPVPRTGRPLRNPVLTPRPAGVEDILTVTSERLLGFAGSDPLDEDYPVFFTLTRAEAQALGDDLTTVLLEYQRLRQLASTPPFGGREQLEPQGDWVNLPRPQ